MVSMSIYRPECQNEKLGKVACDSRATFEITDVDGKKFLCCGAHAKSALFELTMAAGSSELARADRSPKAVRS